MYKSLQHRLLANLLKSIDETSEILNELREIERKAVVEGDDAAYTFGADFESIDHEILLGITARMAKSHQHVCNGCTGLEKIIKLD